MEFLSHFFERRLLTIQYSSTPPSFATTTLSNIIWFFYRSKSWIIILSIFYGSEKINMFKKIYYMKFIKYLSSDSQPNPQWSLYHIFTLFKHILSLFSVIFFNQIRELTMGWSKVGEPKIIKVCKNIVSLSLSLYLTGYRIQLKDDHYFFVSVYLKKETDNGKDLQKVQIVVWFCILLSFSVKIW